MTSIKLIVGLGNPGAEYAQTRHNVGAWFVERLAQHFQQNLRNEPKFHGVTATIQHAHTTCYLLTPTTYMNESGIAVNSMAHFYKIKPAEILVAHDELDFPCGQIRLKTDGGHGGHNGLRDIIQHLQNKQFHRLRIGISHPGHKDRVTPHVLGRPSAADYTRIQQAIDECLTILPSILNGDLAAAMRQLHQTE